MTEVAPSKRDLRAGVHHHGHACPPTLDSHPGGPTQIMNPQTEDTATLTRSKRRRPQPAQSPTIDAVGRTQLRRLRAFKSREVGEERPETSNPKSGTEPLECSITEQELQPSLDYGLNIQRHDPSKPTEHVNNRQPAFFVIKIPPHSVLVRSSDFKSDVSRPSNWLQNAELIRIKHSLAGRLEVIQGSTYSGTYAGFWDMLELCQRYGLTGLEKGLRAWEQQAAAKKPVKKPQPSEFIGITDFTSTVIVRRSNFRINTNNIYKLAGHTRYKVVALRKRLDPGQFDVFLRARGMK